MALRKAPTHGQLRFIYFFYIISDVTVQFCLNYQTSRLKEDRYEVNFIINWTRFFTK